MGRLDPVPSQEELASRIDALPPERLVSLHDAARYLGVSRIGVQRLAARGDLRIIADKVTVVSLREEKRRRVTGSRGPQTGRRLGAVGRFFGEVLLEALNPLNWF